MNPKTHYVIVRYGHGRSDLFWSGGRWRSRLEDAKPYGYSFEAQREIDKERLSPATVEPAVWTGREWKRVYEASRTAASFPKVERVRALGSSEAEYHPGRGIMLTDKFFKLPRGAWLHTLLHELGHWYRDEFVSLAEIMGWEPGEGFSIYDRRNPDEGFAEGFATYFTDPGHFRRNYPEQYERMKGYLKGKEGPLLKWAKSIDLDAFEDAYEGYSVRASMVASELLKVARLLVV